MTALKIGAIVGSVIIAAGGSAAVATRDKWLPKSEITSDTGSEDDSSIGTGGQQEARGAQNTGPGQASTADRAQETGGSVGDASGKQCTSGGDQTEGECRSA